MSISIEVPSPQQPKSNSAALVSRVWAGVMGCMSREVLINRGLLSGLLVVGGLIAFEVFNFGTTDYALTDMLGDSRFLGVRAAAMLAFALCATDFAGLARLFTPDGKKASVEIWYLTGAWFLGATANAMLTWWAVSTLMVNTASRNTILTRSEILAYGPVFIAAVVWLTRICLIATVEIAGQKLFAPPGSEGAEPKHAQMNQTEPKEVPAVLRPMSHHGRAAAERGSTTAVDRMRELELSTAASRRGLRDDLEDG